MNLWAVLRGKERPTGRHMLVLGGLVVIFLLSTAWTVAYTSQSSYCGTCHEMGEMHKTWQSSSHKNVDCIQCHSEPGTAGLVKAKANGLKQLWVHMTSSQITPRASEQDINCYSCHQDKVKTNSDKALAAKDPHSHKHFDNGMTCITCHSGIVHNANVNNVLPNRVTCANCHLETMAK